MRVLLVSANTETINMPVLPLGLAFVHAALKDRGFDARLVDPGAGEDAESKIAAAVREFSPDAIGISVRNIDTQDIKNPGFMLGPVRSMTDLCRKLTDAPIILGGAGYSIYPAAALDYIGADMGIQGEGESAFPDLLDRLAAGRPVSDIPGLYLPGRGPSIPRQCIRETGSIRFPEPEADLPVPRHLDPEDLWMPFQTRRGCPLNCSYCSTGAIEGRLIRKFSVSRAVRNLTAHAQAGFQRFYFVDNTFNLPPEYAGDLCDAIIAENLEIGWRCILYPGKVSEKLVGKMARAGCREVSLGFESGNDEMLARFRKRFTTADVRAAASLLGAYGIARMGFLMLGGPGETRKTVMESLDFMDSLHLESMKVTAGIRIYPHTALAELAVREGMVKEADSLLHPAFYIRPELASWLMETLPAWAAARPNCVY